MREMCRVRGLCGGQVGINSLRTRAPEGGPPFPVTTFKWGHSSPDFEPMAGGPLPSGPTDTGTQPLRTGVYINCKCPRPGRGSSPLSHGPSKGLLNLGRSQCGFKTRLFLLNFAPKLGGRSGSPVVLYHNVNERWGVPMDQRRWAHGLSKGRFQENAEVRKVSVSFEDFKPTIEARHELAPGPYLHRGPPQNARIYECNVRLNAQKEVLD